MNKKGKRKNDLRSSIILLLILLLLLITSTYAWFTANQTVKISSIDVYIEAQNGLQISTNASTWKSIIENTDITTNAYSGNKNQLPTTIEPVSTIGQVDASTGRMKMFYGTVTANKGTGIYELTAKEELYEGAKDESEGSNDEGVRRYVAFDVFLKVDAETKIQLGEGSSVIMTDREGNSDKGIKEASRVAFCVLGKADAGTAADEITPIVGGTTSYIWEPNANLHTAAAKEHAANNYQVGDLLTDGSDDAIPYYGIKQAITTAVPIANTNGGDTTNFAAVTTIPTDGDEDGVIVGTQELLTLQPGISKVRVYMWIEGQDFDCENTASGTYISYNLQLEVVPNTPTPTPEG